MEDKRQQDWDRQTFIHWSNLVKSVPAEELGIEVDQAAELRRNFEIRIFNANLGSS